MQTRVEENGSIALPESMRQLLNLKIGDTLEVRIASGSIVLAPAHETQFNSKIVIDPITGHPSLDAGPDAPVLTSEQVEAMLAEFP